MAEFEALGAGGTEAQFQQFLSYLFRQTSTGLASTGVVTGLQVTQTASASAAVLVSAGMGIAQDSVLNGATPLINNTSKTQDVLVANPASANPRNDIVVFDAGTSPKAIRVITGTPNATPTDPTIPATAIPLARLRITGSATTVPTAQIDDLRPITALAGPIVETGSVTITPSAANVATNATVTLTAGRFSATPKVLVSIGTGITGTVTCFVWTDNESTSSFRAWVNRSSTTATKINWMAVQ